MSGRLARTVASGEDRNPPLPGYASALARSLRTAMAGEVDFEPDIGIAAVQVLESAGFRVTFPDRWVCCGRPLYDYGMLDLARHYLTRTLKVLRPQIEAGIPVIGLEPSCLATFRDELVNMLPEDLDAQRLKSQSYVLSEFLSGHAPGWTPPRLDREALVQPHCHHHSVIGFDAETRLLKAMGLNVEIPDAGCCGMAGSFGYEAGERYRVSMAEGERKLLPAIRDAARETLIIADGFSCRGQPTGDGLRRRCPAKPVQPCPPQGSGWRGHDRSGRWSCRGHPACRTLISPGEGYRCQRNAPHRGSPANFATTPTRNIPARSGRRLVPCHGKRPQRGFSGVCGASFPYLTSTAGVLR